MGFNQAHTLCSELERCLHAALVKLMLGLHSYLGTTNSVLWKEPVLLAPFLFIMWAVSFVGCMVC